MSSTPACRSSLVRELSLGRPQAAAQVHEQLVREAACSRISGTKLNCAIASVFTGVTAVHVAVRGWPSISAIHRSNRRRRGLPGCVAIALHRDRSLEDQVEAPEGLPCTQMFSPASKSISFATVRI